MMSNLYKRNRKLLQANIIINGIWFVDGNMRYMLLLNFSREQDEKYPFNVKHDIR